MLIFPPKLLFSFPTLQFPTPKTLTLIPSSQILTRTRARSFSGVRCSCSSSVFDDGVESELGRLLSLLPENMRGRVENHPELHGLIEVVMDLGRKPLARFPSGDFDLAESPITVHDIEFATSQVGDFALDNRAGISRTLHRISAIRNRKGAIIGLTCRVGRAITGSADLLRDLVKDGASLLLIGPPGVGKTTIIREIARMLAVDYGKRVMIVDTSNEIGGDGDIPHAGIGSARRMQVPVSDMQHRVLIEAVENHMPQVIVIDEIGTKLEAMAATTISQRGIQLVATAHGITIDNLLKNPALDMLVGGIQSVTLGDEEASRRRVQKTILERKGPPTFLCAVEIMSKTELRVHRSLEATVDALLAGRCPEFDVRKLNFQGHEENTKEGNTKEELLEPFSKGSNGHYVPETIPFMDIGKADRGVSLLKSPAIVETSENDVRSIRLFVYGILEATVLQGVRKLNLEDEIELTDNVSEADVLLALQSKLKKNLGIQAAAKSHDKPIYVAKTSSLVQVMKALRSLTNDHDDISKGFELEDQPKSSEKIDALEEARIAIEQVVIGKGEAVELLARPAHIVRLQADLARRYQLQSEVVGVNPEARLHIFPIYFTTEKQNDEDGVEGDTGLEEFLQSNGNGTNGSSLYVERLPILPD